ncbi:efflux RND transporter periplasmic adaptor subunit [Salipiger bermudensis]|uniref:efflux RND transporter periplasmic adaptor subunit n=1 Tax=Salipiger bermudensis TaxID=344736 RepID=UPI001C99FDFD|nr:efflux RND transporter periplasmic adaptor subunit [Salipiger bermudensis]MBY6006386.1 efflux RND transporter periplasmic adaptor subunit [Salipiger bermudensis]
MPRYDHRALKFGLALFAAIALTACNEDDAESAAPSGTLPSVVVAEVVSRDVVETERFIGRAEAVDTTDLRPRVEGFLEERRARDGERVAEGDTLFKIEPAPYEAALAQAEASVAEAEAALQLAEVDLARSTQLLERDTISQADYDASVANRATAEARLQAAEARRQEAEIRLGYTEMKAPFDGRIGSIEFSQGEVVGPASGSLANITRMSPINVSFGLSERDLVELLDWAGQETRDLGGGDAALVRVQLPTGRMHDEEGRLIFVDNRIDPATGTITVQAEFPNASETLVPGMFVNVEIGQREPEIRNTLPQAALQQDQQGSYVLVVGEGDLVEQRYVRLGSNFGTDVVVLSGAEEGERVIVEGLQRVRNGQPVEPVPAAAPAGASATEE